MSARAQWLEARRAGIGGSDAAAILGLDPWKSPLDVFRSKVEPVEPTEDEVFLFKLGHRLEPVIAGLYSDETGRDIYSPDPEVVQHLKYPEILGSMDRLAPQDGRVVELKSEHQFADKFGDPGTDQVPEHYVIQCAHYMAVADLDRCDVAVLHGGFKFSIYQLERDLALERSLMDQLRGWWADHVVKRVEPPIDASESWANFLAIKYPFNKGPVLEVTENTHPALMHEVYNVLNYGDTIKQLAGRLEQAKNNVRAFIGENDGIRGPWGKITWRLCKDTTRTEVNFDQVLDQLAKRYEIQSSELEQLREEAMETKVAKKGGRRFVPKRAKELSEQIIPDSTQEEMFINGNGS